MIRSARQNGFTPVPGNHRFSVRGFTFVEALIATGLLAIMMAAIMVIVQTAVESIGVSRVRAVATGLARDRLELAHAVVYEDVGTVGGIPSGTIPPDEVLTTTGQEFRLETDIVYVDDPFDGVAPIDVIPTDYKRVRVQVSWDGVFKSAPVILWSDIAPKGLETMVGAGTLSLLVYNAQGVPESGAQVEVIAESLTPPVMSTVSSDIDGRVVLPGAPICVSCYKIRVTKSGYTNDRTYGTEEVTNPLKPHLSVLEGLVTEASFAIDRPATVVFKTVRGPAQNYAPFAGVDFNVRGTKEIGRTALDEPVYRYDKNFVTTGMSAQVIVSDLIWDTYTISMPSGSSVEYAGSLPWNPMVVLPNSYQDNRIVVVVNSANSLLVRVKDILEAPPASASVTLFNLGTVVATRSTGLTSQPDWGQAYFPNLNPTTYDLLVHSLGYQEATASVTIAGDKQETFVLNP